MSRIELKWEYRELTRKIGEEELPTEEELNALGQKGWELAGVYSDSSLVKFYFKRPR